MESWSKLKQLRVCKHWTLAQAAARLEVAVNTLSRWEQGHQRPYLNSIDRLCEVYGCTEEELGLGVGIPVPLPPEAIPALLHVPTPSGDVLTRFREQDVTLRLLRIASDCPLHDLSCQHIQGRVLQVLKDDANKSNETNRALSRREAIWRLAAFPLELYGLAALSGTAAKQPPPEGVVAHCAAGVTACYHLSTNTEELASVTNIAASYIPALKTIVESSFQYRKAAADVLVYCYLLRATYARLMEGSNDAFTYIQTADEYSKVSEHVVTRALTLRSLASAHSYANNWGLALQAAEQARHVLEKSKTPAPPMVASYVYAGLANYQAYHGQKQQALSSLSKAHTTFFAASDDESPVCVDHDQSNLLLNDGMTHFHLGLPTKAHDSFEQLHALPKKSALIVVETLLDQVMTEVYRTDPARDMERCITLWQQGTEGAKTIQSDQRLSEAVIAYAAMRAAWPAEARVKTLQQQLVHW